MKRSWVGYKFKVSLIVLLVLVLAYWVAYLKLKPLREFSGLDEQPVSLGTPAGNY